MSRYPRIIFCILLVITGLAGVVHAGPDDIKKKKSQLQKLRKDIDAYDKKIKEREKKEHSTLELLDTYDRQAVLLRRLIGKLHDDEHELENDIEGTRRSIGGLNVQLTFLEDHYARYVSAIYRKGTTYDLELLLASKSFNQLLVRSEYLKRFSEQRRKDLERIGAKRDTYEEQSDLLQRQLAEQRDLIADKSREEANLLDKKKRRKNVLAEIRRDKKNFQREIGRKMAAAKNVEQLIAKLIEEDRLKRERERNLAKEGKSPAPAKESANGGIFEARQNKLRWPVAQGKVIGRFGTQEHPVLHTITQNPGIDIAVPSGTSVEAVLDGEVSAIWWLPSFGNLVIINHNNGYRTVYAHLSEIMVNEKDKVKEGDRIGKSGEALTGPLLHFEVWKDRDKQDPERWLRPRGLSQR